MERPHQREIILTQNLILETLGLTVRPKNKSKFLHYLGTVVVYIMSFGQLLSLSIEIVINMNDFSKVMDTFYMFITEFVYVAKLVNFSFNRRIYKKIIDMIHDPLISQYSDEYDGFVSKCINSSRRIGTIYRWLCLTVVAFFTGIPFINRNPNKPLTIPGYYIVDPKKHKIPCVMLQSVSITISCLACTTLDSLAVFLVRIATVQFHILHGDMSNIGWKMNEERSVEAQLRKTIRKHKFLINFTAKVNYLITYGAFLQFLGSIADICVSGFQLVLVRVNKYS